MREKLVVEFDVEKEIRRDYGYSEKYLLYRGEFTPYKAIVKNGKLLAIVSRKYKLIENERVIDICKAVANNLGMDINCYESGNRVHVFLYANDRGVVVHNSVDGSYAFRIDAVVVLDGTSVIIRVKDIEQVYKKHFSSLEPVVDGLTEIVKEVLDKADEFKYFIDRLDEIRVVDCSEELKVLEDLIPKKYIPRFAYRNLMGEYVTLRSLYERIASNIWTANIDMKTKVQYFDALNNVMFAVAGWK